MNVKDFLRKHAHSYQFQFTVGNLQVRKDATLVKVVTAQGGTLHEAGTTFIIVDEDDERRNWEALFNAENSSQNKLYRKTKDEKIRLAILKYQTNNKVDVYYYAIPNWELKGDEE